MIKVHLQEVDDKKTKHEVNYGAGTREERCKLCEYFRHNQCELVSGRIDPNSVCDLFEEK